MFLKYSSIIAFVVSVIGLFYLIEQNYILSSNPIAIIIQICSFVVIIWARITFGLRSFHASANTTSGELITNGPYKWLRHPIYASIIYFSLACLIAFPNIETLIAVLAIVISTYVRMILEEKTLLKTYKNYAEYSKKAKRLVPFIL